MRDHFCHLHRHGEFSRLDGVGTAKEYAQRAVELNQGILAQTDHGTLSGALHHIAACRSNGIVPIVGVEAYYRPNRASRVTRQAWHLILLAKNLTGWHNLLRMCSIAYANQEDGGGFYQYPCLDDDLLDRHHEGIICTSACFQGWLANLIRAGDYSAARDHIYKQKARFGDDYWLEIMPHDFDDQRLINSAIYDLSNDTSTGVVATDDVHFVFPNWAETQRVSKMMATRLTFQKVEEKIAKGEEIPYTAELVPTIYLCKRSEMESWFDINHPDLPHKFVSEALDNTMVLASGIKPFMLDRTDKLPQATETPEGAEQLLSQWIEEGLELMVKEYPESHWEKYPFADYEARVDFEWSILKDKGVIPYMVIVGDIVRWAKSQGIRIGLGRGSAAGCLISRLVGITAIDPIPWGLLFERFLNPGRKGQPDIDIDVEGKSRARVKEYIIQKYGADRVADIITHERFQPKSVIQRLCTVYDVPYMEARKVTDTIDIRQDDEETTLEELLPINETLRGFKEQYPEIWEHAIRLEGSVANVGKHAGGVVITPGPITDYMALERGKKGDLVTSWSDSADFMVISDNGFLKIDLLGLKELDRHAYACALIKKRHGIDIDLNKLPPLRDPYEVEPEVMELFSAGYTIGTFQFGSKGMTNLIRQIKPTQALDLCAANALYRPGAMKSGATWDYGRFKNGQAEPEYVHPALKGVLGETYGLIAYQEQVMEIAKQLGGFTPAQADDLRKAMGKLYRIKGGKAAKEYMGKHSELWERGSTASGLKKSDREQIWGFVLDRSSYNFNKSHSASYGLTAYQDEWLKKHYPLEFYASILTFPSGSTPAVKHEFISSTVREARTRQVKILPPDINTSETGWSCDDDAIRVGLLAIRDVGEVAAAKIILNRTFGYFSVEDMQQRCGTKVNKKVIEALKESGALDRFGVREQASARQIAAWERDRLRMVLTGNWESSRYADYIRPNIYTQDEVQSIENGATVIIGGEITKIERKKAKNGRPFANLTVSFEMNEWRVKLWESELLAYDRHLVDGNWIMVSGKKDEWNNFVSVVAKQIQSCEQLYAEEQESEAA